MGFQQGKLYSVYGSLSSDYFSGHLFIYNNELPKFDNNNNEYLCENVTEKLGGNCFKDYYNCKVTYMKSIE